MTAIDVKKLDELLDSEMAEIQVTARFISPYVGGQPATEKGIRAFVEHHLHLAGQDADEAVLRIMGKEVRLDKPEDEIKEKESYGINVIRRTDKGEAYVGTWQIHAMLKQAASRLGLFQAKGKVGSKGDLSEGMVISPAGASAVAGPQEVVIVKDGVPYTDRAYEKFMGCVSSPSGRMSIVHDSEVAPVGSEITWVARWLDRKLTSDDMLKVIALGRQCGLGSVKSLERGRWEAIKLEVLA